MRSAVVTVSDLVMDEASRPLSFDVPGGALAALVTSRQDESDRLVRVLLGLAKPLRGAISLLGEDVVAASGKALLGLRTRVAVVQPAGGLVANLKVWENLVLPLEYHTALPQAEIEARGMAALRRVGYTGGLMELPAHLPLHEKRRIGLARAMLADPALIIYNGALTGLAPEEAEAMSSIITGFHREDPGRTALFVTHDRESLGAMPFESRITLSGSCHD